MTADPCDTKRDTPADYSDALYRVYFEVGKWQQVAREAISAFLLERSRNHPAFHFDPASVQAVDHGYELNLPMQLIPEVVRALADRNVAVYQVLRRGRV